MYLPLDEVYSVIMKGATRFRTFFIFPSFCDHTSTSIGILLFRLNALCQTEDFVVHDRHDISLDDTKSQEVYKSHCHWAGDNLIYFTY